MTSINIKWLHWQRSPHTVCTPWFLFWPGSVGFKKTKQDKKQTKKRGLHPPPHPKSYPMIQWKSRQKISKIRWFIYLEKEGFFDLTFHFHVQHGLWLFTNLEVVDVDGNEETQERDFHSVTKNEAALCCHPGRPIVRVAVVNFLSGQTFFPWRGQPLASSTPCS